MKTPLLQSTSSILSCSLLALSGAMLSVSAAAKGPGVGGLTDSMFDKVREESRQVKQQALIKAPAQTQQPPATGGEPSVVSGQGGVALSVPGVIDQMGGEINQLSRALTPTQASSSNELALKRANPDFHYSSPTTGVIKTANTAVSLDPAPVRLAMGDWNLYAIQDRPNSFDPELLKLITSSKLEKLEAAHAVEGKFPGSVTVFILDTGLHQIMFDAGLGSCRGSSGKLKSGMKAAGFTPEDIDLIMITHAHSDHTCGLITESGEAAYPNATVYVSEPEFEFWAGEKPLSGKSAKKQRELRSTSDTAIKAFAPYVAAERLTAFAPKREFFPEIKAVKTLGHTPGHTSYSIERGGVEVFITGDIVHVQDVQLPYPTTAIKYDVSPVQAIVTRMGDFNDQAKAGAVLASVHFPFPGLGKLKKSGQSFTWQAVTPAKLPIN